MNRIAKVIGLLVLVGLLLSGLSFWVVGPGQSLICPDKSGQSQKIHGFPAHYFTSAVPKDCDVFIGDGVIHEDGTVDLPAVTQVDKSAQFSSTRFLLDVLAWTGVALIGFGCWNLLSLVRRRK